MNTLEARALEQVAIHTKPLFTEGVPVKKTLARQLLAQGLVVKATSPDYFKNLKHCDTLICVKITEKGRRRAETVELELFEQEFEQTMSHFAPSCAG